MANKKTKEIENDTEEEEGDGVNNDGQDMTELEQLTKKSEEYLNGWKRAQADYQNYKKEVESRQREVVEFANARLIADLLPIFENFKTSFKHIPEENKDAGWLVGLDHIKKQFEDFLRNLGIEEIKTVGEKFNPIIHEALESEDREGFESGIIFEEIQAGYTLHGKIVSPAKVKVTK